MRDFHLSALRVLDGPTISVVRLDARAQRTDSMSTKAAIIDEHRRHGVDRVFVLRTRGVVSRLAYKALPIFAGYVALIAIRNRSRRILLTEEGFASWLMPSFVLSRCVSVFFHDPEPHESGNGAKEDALRWYNEFVYRRKRWKKIYVGDQRFVQPVSENSRSEVEYLRMPDFGAELYPISTRPPEMDGIDDYLVFYGRIDRYKGVFDWLEANAHLLDVMPPIVVAGRVLDHRVLAFADRVTIINRYIKTTEVGLLLANAAALLLPYKSATQSGVGDLALSFGTPIFFSNQPYFEGRYAGRPDCYPIAELNAVLGIPVDDARGSNTR